MDETTYQAIAMIVYFVGMLAIGGWAYGLNNDLDDYMLADRGLNPWVAALSAGASDMSGWLLMGLPGALFVSGMSELWIAVGLLAGAWANWTYVAPRLRSYSVWPTIRSPSHRSLKTASVISRGQLDW